MTTNPTPNPDANPPAKGCPDELAAGRAEFLRLCAALASGSQDGIANVLATLSTLHAAAWQLCLQAAAREHVSVLGVVLGLEPADLAAQLEREAMAALDDAEGAADRLSGDGGR